MTAMPSAVKAKPPRVQCPHCTYSAEPGASLEGHLSMLHPDAPRGNAVELEAIGCEGSNHIPDCRHFPPAGHAPAAPAVSPSAAGAASALVDLPLELVDVGDNVRVEVAELEELAASIAEHGVLQPVKATGPHADGRYLVVWGQRRTLASRMAGRATVPAILLPPDADVDAHGAARAVEQLVENLHRADLNPIDRARAMRAVVDSGTSQADLARSLGISPATVSNDLRILTLADPVLEQVRSGQLTASHAKAIASLPPRQQEDVARMVTRQSMSSKDLERTLEYKRQEADQDRAKADKSERAIPKVLAALGAADVPKDAEVSIGANFYDWDTDALRAAVVAAGWTKVDSAWHPGRPAGGKCDCTAVRVEMGRSPKVEQVCADRRHQDRQRNADLALQEEARKAYEARVAAVRAEIEAQLREALRMNMLALPVLRLLDLAVRSYAPGDRSKDDLPATIAAGIGDAWRVREAITPELLAELGIEAKA